MNNEKELIEYVKDDLEKLEQRVDRGFTELNVKFDMLTSRFITKEELKTQMDFMQRQVDMLAEALKTKVDKVEFDPIRNTLRKLNWIVISGAVVGLLTLIGLSS